jgi:hypothetical protein
MKGGDYAICNVQEGNLYIWRSCNNSSNFNTQLTLFHGIGCTPANFLDYNDNACNSGSSIIWKATFNGIVTILLNRKNCKITSGNNCGILTWESVFSDCNHPLPFCAGKNIYPATTGQPSTYVPFQNTDWGCGNGMPISNQTWYYFKITQQGPIDLQISTSASINIDGIVWGPFDSLGLACKLTTNPPVACNFSSSQPFHLNINAPANSIGKYYMVMISNTSNQISDIKFSFLNSPNGKIELCQPILSYNDPVCINGNLQLFAYSIENPANYFWTGPNNFTSNSQNPIITNVSSLNAGQYTCYFTTTFGISLTSYIDIVFLPKPVTSNIYHNY